jgi:putative membrane protein
MAIRISTNRCLTGGLAGFLATFPMSAAMLLGYRFLPLRSREELPPEKITHRALQAVDGHDKLSQKEDTALVVVNHFAYGAAMGAVYAQLPPSRNPVSAATTGAGFGLAVWAGSY